MFTVKLHVEKAATIPAQRQADVTESLSFVLAGHQPLGHVCKMNVCLMSDRRGNCTFLKVQRYS